MIEIKVPTPGESITEVEIASWLVDNGSFVNKDQELAEIESDKATLMLTADESGKIEILIPEGETAKVGAVACKIDPSQQGEATPVAEETKTKHEDKQQTARSEKKTIGETRSQLKQSTNIRTTPVARKMMDESHVSVDDIIKGLSKIGKNEVALALDQLNDPTPFLKGFSRESERKKMSSLRKKISERLVKVKNETAMLTTFNEVDMSSVIKFRKKYQKAFQEKHGVKLGFMSFFTKAASIALQSYPNVNSMIDGEEIVQFNYTDIGIAVQTPKGLMVPVFRNIETKSISDIEIEIFETAERARKGRIKLDELSGGTFSVTNGGVFGSMLSTPIINPPQAAILGMHNIVERPVAIDGNIVVRPIMYVALSYDHRIIDGKDSVGFLLKIKDLIENPTKLYYHGDIEQKILGLD